MNLNIAPAVRAIDFKRPMIAKFVISDSYFSVYDANASMLGLVDDRDTRKNIVKLFIAARSFVDMIKTNNTLVQRYEYMENPVNFGNIAEFMRDGLAKGAALSELETFSGGIVSAWQDLESKVEAFFGSTNAWLGAKGAAPNPPPQFAHPKGIEPPPLAATSAPGKALP